MVRVSVEGCKRRKKRVMSGHREHQQAPACQVQQPYQLGSGRSLQQLDELTMHRALSSLPPVAQNRAMARQLDAL